MQISVIILNYNVRFFLEQCIRSVQKSLQNLEGEILVVDNASVDGSVEMVQKLFPDVVVIKNTENVGFPKGNNIGVAQAKGEYICILNPDTVVAEDTFEKILNKCPWDNDLGIVGCKLIDGAGNFLPESKRGVPTPWVAMTKILGLYRFFPNNKNFNQYYAQHLRENESGEVDILVGAFMVMKKELYEEIGGFDENCFMYSDDIDLSYMVRKKKKKNFYFSATTVIHYKGESTVRDGLYMKRFREAMSFFYSKHFKKSFLFDFFMKGGAFLFSVFKKNQQKQNTFVPEKYVFFSNSKEDLGKCLDKQVTRKLRLRDYKKDDLCKTEIIFDTNCFSNKEIIQFMIENKSKEIAFKNYFSQSKYLIGSNDSNDRGIVIEIK